MTIVEKALLESIQRKAKAGKKTRRQRQVEQTSGILAMAEEAATNHSNAAEDLVSPDKLGSLLMEAIKKKNPQIDAPEEEFKDPGPGLRGRTPKRQRPDKGQVVQTKTVIVDGKEVQCKVLAAGQQYYVGKSAPSGRPPGGTHRRAGADPEIEALKKTHHYLERRLESAEEYHRRNPNGIMKGGVHEEDFEEALGNLLEKAAEKGIDLEELV